MDGLKSGEENFVLDLKLNWKAVKLLEDGGGGGVTMRAAKFWANYGLWRSL